MFYAPVGWFGPFTWFLSLPFGPAGLSCLYLFSSIRLSGVLGAVSCAVWTMALKRTVGLVARSVRELMLYQSVAVKEEPIEMQAQGAKVAS